MSEPSHDHHDDHGHHGSRFIQHHYDDAAHQFDSGKLGIWFFLVQEILFFSALFVAYILFRTHHPEIFSYAHHYLDVKWGAINTAVLIVSSLTAAWAVRCAQLNQRKGLIACLSITILCALGFLGIKTIEYTHKIHEHILWGQYFDPCVASAGNHLLNKGNNCPGVKTSVVWDNASAKAQSGCLEGDYDQRPDEPGIQGQCKVAEVKGESKREPKLAADGKPELDKDGKPVMTVVPREQSRRDLEECEMEGGPHGHPKRTPCWELAENYHVCPSGPAAMVVYGDHAKRSTWRADQVSRGISIEVSCTPAVAAAAPPGDAFGPATSTEVEGEPTFRRNPALTKHERQHQFASGPPPEHTSMFFSIYFAMTGLHGIHVLVGVFIFIWLLLRAIRGDFTPEYFGPIDYAALYWHLVDLIWIFLFPLLYLIH